jgi:putative membrane protein
MASKLKDFAVVRPSTRGEVNLAAGLVAGALAGLAATWVLDRYHEGALAATRHAEQVAQADDSFSRRQAEQIRSYQEAREETAKRLAQAALGKRLNRRQQQQTAQTIHYAVGALAGAVYGLTAEWMPLVRSGYGTGFASILFLGGPEALSPWLNPGVPRQSRMTPAMKVKGLSAHLVFGGVLETTRRLVRWIL